MCSIRIVREETSTIPQRVQMMIPYSQTISSRSSSQRTSSKSSLAPSSPIKLDGLSFSFDECLPVSRCCSIVIPVDLDDAETIVHSPGRSVDYYMTNKRKHHGLSSTDIMPIPKSIRPILQTLHENITSLEVDERTLHCEVTEFFGLLESVCKVGVQLTLKQTTDIAFSKDLLMDSFGTLKSHLREVRTNYYTLRDINQSNSLIDGRKQNSSRTLSLENSRKASHSRSSILLSHMHTNRSDDDIHGPFSDSNSASSLPRASSARIGDPDRGHLQRALRDKESECERLSVQLRNLRNQLNKLKGESDRLADMEVERSSLKRSSRAYKTKAERFEDEVKKLTARIQTKEEKVELLQAELQDSQDRLEHIAVDRITDFSEKNTLQSQVTELEIKLTKLEESHKAETTALQLNIDDSTELVVTLRRTNETLTVDKSLLQEKLSTAEAEIHQLLQTTQEFENQIESYRNNIRERQEKQDKLNETIDRLETEKKVMHEKLHTFHRQIGEANQEKLELMRALDDRRVTFERSKRAVTNKIEAALDDRNSLLETITRQKTNDSLSHLSTANGRTSSGAEASLKQTPGTTSYGSDCGASGGSGGSSTDRNRRDTGERIRELELQLRSSMSEQDRIRTERDTIESRTLQRMKDLRGRLDHTQSSNRSLQNYVDYLKTSYSSVFSPRETTVHENGDSHNHHSDINSSS